ncbi:SgrR family transcriptional regulator [Vibrio sp. SCSIO 43137]|uniref:SgrR family transcriptional regulator n=1 Tax=Vibrio sp. SCSIO 43137 TaxID=3021011 RepID=UPI002307A5D4|nr:SgrR family transcriptional regulator [Vibrio sp. SCSIO 43137]WCE32346.1 SgrR family transcriptional regulator [Vibrio sp. SCSIO 43137]
MSQLRLFRYYARLQPLGSKKPLSLALADIAGQLSSTPRHTRTLLSQMQQLNWLHWQPKVGRNNRSQLHLLYSKEELENQIAGELIQSGKYESALELLGDNHERFSQLLQLTSGVKRREGNLHLQLTYPRRFAPLLPHLPHRNSERFLIRQIYSCLISCDSSGKLTPQLAHHWRSENDHTCWRFFLRPNLSFHNGEPISAQNLAALFTKLSSYPEYRQELEHVKSIQAQGQSIIFHLSTSDRGLAGLLSDIRYSVQPESQLNHTGVVTGSGMFQVTEHSEQRLRLHAFDHYFGYRALTDSVTIWQVQQENKGNSAFGTTRIDTRLAKHASSTCSHFLSAEEELSDMKSPEQIAQDREYTRIEDGSIYMQFNMNPQYAGLSAAQRRYLAQLFTSQTILDKLQEREERIEADAAFNLLPGWCKIQTISRDIAELPESITIAVYDHFALKEVANIITDTLYGLGVKCSLNIYSYQELQQRSQQKLLDEQIILNSFNLDDNRPVSAFRWFSSHSSFHHCLSPEANLWLGQQLSIVRSNCDITEYLDKLESLSSTMINENWIVPLLHHRQTLQFEGLLKDVSITDWGWPAFQDVWQEE